MAQLHDGIWVRVSNTRIESGRVEIQVAGDQQDREPAWWPVAKKAAGDSELETFRALAEGLDKKRTVLARLEVIKNGTSETEEFGLGSSVPKLYLGCRAVRIQHTEARLS